MKEKFFEEVKKRQILILTIFSAFLGLMVFLWIYGPEVLNFTNVAWLEAAGDLTQHYTGWVFFRNADWTFPLGLFNGLSYPHYASIVYTDSIPLFAVFFKAISGILPQTFQYMGLYGVMCYMLQGVFAFTLLRKFIKNKAYAIVRNCVFYILALCVTENVWSYSPCWKLLNS